MAREFIKLYFDYIESIKLLSDAECGRLFVALLEYGKSGAEQKLSGNERFLYALIKTQLDIDKSQNRGGAPKGNQNAKKQPVDFENNINQPKQPVDFENNSKQQVDFREKEEAPPLCPPSSFPPRPPISSPPYNPPAEEKDRNGGNERGVRAHAHEDSDESPSPSPEKPEWLTRDEFLYLLANNNHDLPEAVGNTVMSWLDYKYRRAEPYIPADFNSLLSEVSNNCRKHGESAVIALISRCMEAESAVLDWEILPVEYAEKSTNPQDLGFFEHIQHKAGQKKKTQFKPPTVEEVGAYCAERKSTVNPEQFVNFYTAKGWRIGKEVMRDWKAAVRTWENREKTEKAQAQPVEKASSFDLEEFFNKAAAKSMKRCGDAAE